MLVQPLAYACTTFRLCLCNLLHMLVQSRADINTHACRRIGKGEKRVEIKDVSFGSLAIPNDLVTCPRSGRGRWVDCY